MVFVSLFVIICNLKKNYLFNYLLNHFKMDQLFVIICLIVYNYFTLSTHSGSPPFSAPLTSATGLATEQLSCPRHQLSIATVLSLMTYSSKLSLIIFIILELFQLFVWLISLFWQPNAHFARLYIHANSAFVIVLAIQWFYWLLLQTETITMAK